MSEQPGLFDREPPGAGAGPGDAAAAKDRAARAFATDPRENVVLEASAGTGKTSVLVERYLNLLRAGVDPANILAITFTRKAAAEMRERIVSGLRDAAARSAADRARWLELRDRLGEIGVETIDAFCLSLIREFPLEADLDPGFELADETEVPRLVDGALDRALRIAVALARDDADLALVLAQLGAPRARAGLAHLLARRLVAREALERFLARGPSDLTVETAARRAVAGLENALAGLPDGLEAFLAAGPVRHPKFQVLAATLAGLPGLGDAPAAEVRVALDRLRAHFLTLDGRPRGARIPPYTVADCESAAAWRRHREAVSAVAPRVAEALAAWDRDLNVVLARGLKRLFRVAEAQYARALAARSLVDFTGLVERALGLLRRMDEFAQSRFRLESRYHHVLVDEFQDTSRAQWELIALLIQSWGEGFGLVHDAPLEPSIFVVGDRKQSIYRFRDANVRVLDDAARFIEALRPAGPPRRSIARSFRAVPELLEFVNDVFAEVDRVERPDAFRYGEDDRFPVDDAALGDARGGARDRAGGGRVARSVRRPPWPPRSRASSTRAPSATGGPASRAPCAPATWPSSSARARATASSSAPSRRGACRRTCTRASASSTPTRSRTCRRCCATWPTRRRACAPPRCCGRGSCGVSDAALAALAPDLAGALAAPDPPAATASLDAADRAVVARARESVRGWLELVDRIPPADLLDRVLAESAYAFELGGPRRQQAWENVKKLRALARRIQNRGYATLARIADYIECLHTGDESNAALEALDAVNLMTVHAAKGLEFPVVFVVNLAKGAGGSRPPVRLFADGDADEPSVSIGAHVSAADEDESAKEREETKRLVYVALTRARDRLYLASVLKDGSLEAARGSLAEVLPLSLAALFGAAGAPDAADELVWASARGRRYRVRLCRPADPVAPGAAPDAAPRADAFLTGGGPAAPLRAAVTDWTAAGAAAPSGDAERAVGALVHRLFQHAAELEAPAVHALAAALADRLGAIDAAGRERTVERAAALYLELRARDDVRELLEDGERLYEVPFSLWLPPGAAPSGTGRPPLLRGAIDCLVITPGEAVVVELKTGRPRPEHDAQLALYVTAARALFPDRSVRGQLIYA